MHMQFHRVCEEMGLTTDMRNAMQLVDIKPQNRKYPFIYKDCRNHYRYKCTVARAKQMFSKEA